MRAFPMRVSLLRLAAVTAVSRGLAPVLRGPSAAWTVAAFLGWGLAHARVRLVSGRNPGIADGSGLSSRLPWTHLSAPACRPRVPSVTETPCFTPSGRRPSPAPIGTSPASSWLSDAPADAWGLIPHPPLKVLRDTSMIAPGIPQTSWTTLERARSSSSQTRTGTGSPDPYLLME